MISEAILPFQSSRFDIDIGDGIFTCTVSRVVLVHNHQHKLQNNLNLNLNKYDLDLAPHPKVHLHGFRTYLTVSQGSQFQITIM